MNLGMVRLGKRWGPHDYFQRDFNLWPNFLTSNQGPQVSGDILSLLVGIILPSGTGRNTNQWDVPEWGMQP